MKTTIRLSTFTLSVLLIASCGSGTQTIESIESIEANSSIAPSRYEFTTILSNAPWEFGQEAAGMAAGLDDTVYIANGDTLWQVKKGVVSVYLGPEHGDFEFSDVDIDSSGVIYVVNHGLQILSSNAEGTYSIHRDNLDLMFPYHFGIKNSSEIAMISREGLNLVTDYPVCQPAVKQTQSELT